MARAFQCIFETSVRLRLNSLSRRASCSYCLSLPHPRSRLDSFSTSRLGIGLERGECSPRGCPTRSRSHLLSSFVLQHSSRNLFFQSANAGFAIFVDLVMYGIGTVSLYLIALRGLPADNLLTRLFPQTALKKPNGSPAWRAIGLFLGGSTIFAGGIW